MTSLKPPLPKAIRIDAERSARIDAHVAGQIAPDGPGLALAIAADGMVAHSAGYGLTDIQGRRPIGPDTIFHLASSGKQFTALGILMLVESGKIQLDDAVGKYIPSIAGFGPKVTIRKLLHHTSGIRDLYDDEGMGQILARCAQPTNADLVRTYAELGCPAARQPAGDAFSYSNSGYELLGAIIEAVSGESYRDFFERHVFGRLKMQDTFSFLATDPRMARCATGYIYDGGRLAPAGGSALDNLVGSGSFYTTVSDLCLYDQALRTHRLVAAATLTEAFASGRTNNGETTNYGFGWYLETRRGTLFGDHDGIWNGFRSYIRYGLTRPLSVFVLSNHPNADLFRIVDVATDAFH